MITDDFASMLGGLSGGSGKAAQVRTMAVKAVEGDAASCVRQGDADARTQVRLLGHACAPGDTLVAVGQSGRWYAVGNAGGAQVLELAHGVKAWRNAFGAVTISATGGAAVRVPGNWGNVYLGTLPEGWRPAANVAGPLLPVYGYSDGLVPYIQTQPDGYTLLINPMGRAMEVENLYCSLTYAAVR